MGFQSKRFRSAAEMNSIGMRYRRVMNRHPFLMFGLPFMAVIVAGSFVLTPATAVRYERYDRKVRQMTKEEELNVRRSARKVDMKEEYYVRHLHHLRRHHAYCVPFALRHVSEDKGHAWLTGLCG